MNEEQSHNSPFVGFEGDIFTAETKYDYQKRGCYFSLIMKIDESNYLNVNSNSDIAARKSLDVACWKSSKNIGLKLNEQKPMLVN